VAALVADGIRRVQHPEVQVVVDWVQQMEVARMAPMDWAVAVAVVLHQVTQLEMVELA
jgi:hypothetical protein